MSFQSKLAKKVAPYQRKITDFHIEQLGSEVELTRVSIIENKYHDKEFSITSSGSVAGIINYPDSELPILFNSSDNTDNSTSIHMYNLLPIEGFFKFENNLNKGDILLQKIKVNPTGDVAVSSNFRIMMLQVVDVIGKASLEVTYLKYHLAPITLSIDNGLPALQPIIDSLLNADWVDY